LSHVVVSKVPLARGEILQAFGGLVEFRLYTDHYGSRALQPCKNIQDMRGKRMLKRPAQFVQEDGAVTATVRVPERVIRRMYPAILERQLDELLPCYRILLTGAAVIDRDAIDALRGRSPGGADHQVDHYVDRH